MAHKIEYQMMYTEVVYYDDDGDEVGRERIHDDHTYDSYGPLDLENWERERYGLDTTSELG